MITKLKEFLKNNSAIKNIVLFCLMPRNQARPRLWVKLLVNPLVHKTGKGACIRRRSRIDTLPFNKFVVGDKSTIEDFSVVNNGVGDVIIGSNTRIGLSNVIIGPITIGNNVMTAQHVAFSGLNHGFEDITLPPSLQPISTSQIIIEDDVWIGANAVIVAGIKIGKHAVIGAGSVVTKDVPAFSVAVGNPAKVIKKYDEASKLWIKP